MTLYTIGFTRKSAETFFESLRAAGVRRVVDIRLNNTSQLSAFAKRDDLAYFLRRNAGIDYLHRPDWAPTPEILADYKKRRIDWPEYERRFNLLIRERRIERSVEPSLLDGACLLCSEPKADRCHRRLVAEYLQRAVQGLEICHL